MIALMDNMIYWTRETENVINNQSLPNEPGAPRKKTLKEHFEKMND
jgi:hypothetical protein